jgi:hypothetical protein
MLAPNADRIRKLREDREWTIDDACFHARTLKIPLSRQTLVDLESGTAGCRLATLGWIKRLYGVRDLDELTVELPDPPKKRSARPRSS